MRKIILLLTIAFSIQGLTMSDISAKNVDASNKGKSGTEAHLEIDGAKSASSTNSLKMPFSSADDLRLTRGASLHTPAFGVENAEVTITGTVTDSQGEPMPGVTVSVQGTTIGTATDLDGRYSISVPEGSTMVFSFIGFETQRVPVGAQSVLNITLQEDISSLSEVVVVGYGVQRRSDVTGSVASLPKERLEMVPNINIAQAIQGSIPGVMVQNTAAGA